MTVHRVKTCSCGHPVDWHDQKTGRCTYGHGHVMGGCTCVRFEKRRRGSPKAATAPATTVQSPLERAIDDTIRALVALKSALDGARPVDVRATSAGPVSIVAPERRKVVVGTPASEKKLGGGDRKILTVLAQHPDGLSKVQVALMTGYSHTSGGFRNYLSALRSTGHLEGAGERMRITEAGRRELGAFEPLPAGPALLEYWKTNAGGKCERLILAELAAEHPRLLSSAAVASRTGYAATSGGFRNALSRLRTLQLIRGRGEVGLTPALAGAIAVGGGR